MQSIQNLGLAVVSIVAGSLLDSKGYLLLEVFFSACLCGKHLYILYFVFIFGSELVVLLGMMT